MRPSSAVSTISAYLSPDILQALWQQLNARYFSGSLPRIAIRWSRRLTSSVGMFVSRGGPRTSRPATPNRSHREIRLSLPLFVRLAERSSYVEQELLNTIAHEMIHQWQFDVLKRRPDHGLEFLRKMTEINRSGEVSITTYHSLENEVFALSRFAWRCNDCGRVYRRQRNTIQPEHHHCGVCRGSLLKILSPLQESENQPLPDFTDAAYTLSPSTASNRFPRPPEQLTLAWA
jgi:predicted SprT family Zn-dependent metalloprotease